MVYSDLGFLYDRILEVPSATCGRRWHFPMLAAVVYVSILKVLKDHSNEKQT